MNPFADWVWGAPHWAGWALAVAAILAIVVLWNYAFSPGPKTGFAALAAVLKLSAIGLLAICLLQPMRSGTRPKPQSNLVVLMVDNSASMALQSTPESPSRADQVRQLVRPEEAWRVRLAQDFDVRSYAFDSRLDNVTDLHTLPMDGWASSLTTGLEGLATRLRDRPVAGVLLFSDGNATDVPTERSPNWSQLGFPVYPVVHRAEERIVDARIADVSVSRSDFETAPVTVRVRVEADGLAGQPAIVQLTDGQTGVVVQEQAIVLAESDRGEELADPGDQVDQADVGDSTDVVAAGGAGGRAAPQGGTQVTFRFRPIRQGVGFYRVAVFRPSDRATWDSPAAAGEVTFRNNSRWLTVEGSRGPHRILYLAGRPNWEFKFLRRALQEDAEIDLVGLLRIADKEAKFTFRDRDVSTSNPLFVGLEETDGETAERYDEAVLIRLGVRDADELARGFPRTAEELFPFDAVILDDIEPEFFSQDQLRLLRRFVAQRGGGLMLLGGPEAFAGKRFAQGTLGELSPLYPPRDRDGVETGLPAGGPNGIGRGYRLELTREGMLQPWVRLRETERAEADRIAGMPAFQTRSPTGLAKPGASVLAMVRDPEGDVTPAIAAQRFGKGRTVAIPLGDLWRWSMRRPLSTRRFSGSSAGLVGSPLAVGEQEGDPTRGGPSSAETFPARDDPAQAWRQITRWLVNESPRRVECRVIASDDPGEPVRLVTTVWDETFGPVENATVRLEITPPASSGDDGPAGEPFTLTAEADWDLPGRYVARYWAREPGGYRVTARVVAEDASEVGEAQTGWTADPSAAEFRQLTVNRSGLERLADATGGELVDADRLDAFVASLPSRKVPVTQAWVYPIWHRPWVMMLAILCLCGEWGIRRWKGLP
ncbi:MAG: hypothetical protein EA381_10285 [Planctomycetaceae bacterium]|nr:MAG: hypothetical protein EA381_10285 [Planctomycetaceae bacterium]